MNNETNTEMNATETKPQSEKANAKGAKAGAKATPTSKVNAKESDSKPKADPKAKAKANPKAKANKTSTDTKTIAAEKVNALSKAKSAPKAKAGGKVAKAAAKKKAAAMKTAPAKKKQGKSAAEGKGSNGGKPKDDAGDPPKKPIEKGKVKDIRKRLKLATDAALNAEEEGDAESQEDEEEHEFDDDDAADAEDGELNPEGKRDRSKTKKFEALLGQGKIPSHIVDMLDKGSANAKNSRKWKTQVINQLFNRDGNGKLVMMPHAPFFTAWKETNESSSLTKAQKALPRTIFCGKYFSNNQSALDNAIAVGDVDVVSVGGKEFLSFVSWEHLKTKGKTDTQKVLQVDKKIDDATSNQMSHAFDNLSFGFKKIAKEPPLAILDNKASASAIVPAEIQPPLLGDDVFEKIKSVFEDAKTALDRISRDILKLVTKTTDDEKVTSNL